MSQLEDHPALAVQPALDNVRTRKGRAASHTQQNLPLDDQVMDASGHPCPMRLAAMHLAGMIRPVSYAYSNEDGEPFGLSTKDLVPTSALLRSRPLRSLAGHQH